MLHFASDQSRREFLQRLGSPGIVCSVSPLIAGKVLAEDKTALPDPALKFPGPWQFSLHKGGIILVSDQQLEDLQDPDKVVDLSLSQTPNPTTLRKICEQTKAAGGRTVILAFDARQDLATLLKALAALAANGA